MNTSFRIRLNSPLGIFVAASLPIATIVACILTPPLPMAVLVCIVLGLVAGAIPMMAPFENWLGYVASIATVFGALWINSQLPSPNGNTELGLVGVAVTSRMLFGSGFALLYRWIRRTRGIKEVDV